MSPFARELGTVMIGEGAIVFLNRDGRAYGMWKPMMQAGEEYIKTTLAQQIPYACARIIPSAPALRCK